MNADPVRGKTLRWTFTDGQMAGKSYDHVFSDDGTVSWAEPGQKAGADSSAKYQVESVNDDVYVVSYLSGSGYTLTTIVDSKAGSIVSFASNEKELSTHHGRVEVAKTS